MRRTLFIVGIMSVLLLLTRPLLGDPETRSAPEEFAAKVAGTEIRMAEVDQAAKQDLFSLSSKIYQVKKRHLDQLVEEVLFQKEAERLDKPVSEIKTEFSEESVTVTNDAVQTYFDENSQHFRGKPFEEVKDNIRDYLVQGEVGKKKDAFVSELRGRFPVEIYLEAPTVKIDIEGQPFRGPKDAPITLVEFSDFQCPYCRRFKDTVDQLVREYPKELKHVFRHNPLPFHKQAKVAHHASVCAEKQGKFWEYRDTLFANIKALGEDQLRKYAEELGLDMGAFDECMSDPNVDKVLDQDSEYSVSVGARGTPTSFINGVLFSGAQPYENLKRAVEEKLAQQS